MNTLEKICVSALFAVGFSASVAATPTATPTDLRQHAEYAAIDKTMQTMMQAFERGDGKLAHQVILQDTAVIGYSRKQQKVLNISGEQWAADFEPAEDEAQRHRQYQILDISDSGALVKVMLDYPGWLGVDYLALVKVNEQWRVISKSWSGKLKQSK
jgi:hypothetical protein